MLIQYTTVSSLSESEKTQLRVMLGRMVLEGRAYIDFFGKYLAVSELLPLQRMWEGAQNKNAKRVLLG